MKFLVILALTLLCLSSGINSVKVKKSRVNVLHNLRVFLEGVLESLSGGHLKECFPTKWGSPELQNDATSKGATHNMEEGYKVIKKVMRVINKATKKLCGPNFYLVKSFVSKFLLMGIRRNFSYTRKWGFWQAITNAVKHYANGVAHTVHTLGKAAVDWFKATIPDLVNVRDQVLIIFTAMKRLMKNTFAIILRIIRCALGAATLILTMINIMRGIRCVSMGITTGGASLAVQLPIIIANLICAWEEIMKAFQTLVSVFTSSGAQKVFQFGKFAGQLAKLFGVAFGGVAAVKQGMPIIPPEPHKFGKVVDRLTNVEKMWDKRNQRLDN
jgi:hypothetical protein